MEYFRCKVSDFSITDLKGLNFKGLAFSVGFTILLMTALVGLLSIKLLEDQPVIIYGLLMMNSPSISVSGKDALMDMGKITIAIRFIVGPLLGVLSAYITTRVCLSKKTDGRVLEHTISYAFIYAIIMSVIALAAGHGVTTTDTGMTVMIKIGVMSTFINSFMIAILGGYLGISRQSKESFINYSIKTSLLSVLGGIVASSVIAYALIYYEAKKYIEYYGGNIDSIMTNHPFANNFEILLAGFIIILMGVWLFTLANFASISILGITSYNIFSLYNETNFLTLLCPIIPIVLLILVGRKIKTMYGEDNIKMISIFSGFYTLMIAGFAYFTRIVFSLNLGQFKGMINEFVQNEMYELGIFNYSDKIQEYIDKIYSSMDSGLYIGPNIGIIIIATFIFSCIIVYIGSKSKK